MTAVVRIGLMAPSTTVDCDNCDEEIVVLVNGLDWDRVCRDVDNHECPEDHQ